MDISARGSELGGERGAERGEQWRDGDALLALKVFANSRAVIDPGPQPGVEFVECS